MIYIGHRQLLENKTSLKNEPWHHIWWVRQELQSRRKCDGGKCCIKGTVSSTSALLLRTTLWPNQSFDEPCVLNIRPIFKSVPIHAGALPALRWKNMVPVIKYWWYVLIGSKKVHLGRLKNYSSRSKVCKGTVFFLLSTVWSNKHIGCMFVQYVQLRFCSCNM